ncbi:hypothetical protein FB45DRAFT_1066844 [Roridomyces roridus]|uniref:Cyclin N-terminal domain-containing protein n=1 Tax=Roridomyces roridus TaxID=1738132 RepID=A0AAD7FBN7_9AGAR|nr:hypothetical protein FB45DRAFT_1066844 [Roridomyces roridus]
MAASLVELASWSHTHTHSMPMTPPHTDRLQPTTTTANAYPPHSSSSMAVARQGQLLTPPDDEPMSDVVDNKESDAPLAWAHDWLHVSRTRPESAALVAEKTCEMICYLWFAPSSSSAASSPPNALQLTASPTFVAFTQKLLETTQVSQSVIVLALHYIHRLRLAATPSSASSSSSPSTSSTAPTPTPAPPQPGSEFRVAVAALLLANKFLDDNTYTNATWASVSGIPLTQINVMEHEFLVGCGWNMYVSEDTYLDWGRLLRGLVGARRAQVGRWQHRRRDVPRSTTTTTRKGLAAAARRRSVSPTPRRALPPPPVYVPPPSEDVEMTNGEEGHVGSKRRAAAAFSPVSYHPPALQHTWPVYSSAAPYAEYTPPSHAQRPAPTLVIPQAHSSSFHPSSSAASSASTNSYSNPHSAAPYYAPQPSLNTPLERFGALSLSSSSSAPRPRTPSPRPFFSTAYSTPASSSSTRRSTRTPSPQRPLPFLSAGTNGRRVRPVSYAGNSATAAWAEHARVSPVPAPTYVTAVYRPPVVYDYVPPAPSTIVQYPPQPPFRGPAPPPLPPVQQQQQSPVKIVQPQPKQPAQQLAARWEYSDSFSAQQAKSQDDLYFYQLAASPVSSASSGSDDDEREEGEEGRCECDQCRWEDGEEVDDDDEGSEDGEDEDEEEDASSACSDHGYGDEDGDEPMYAPPPVSYPNASAHRHRQQQQQAAEARVDALRRARLRCVPAPTPAPALSMSTTYPRPLHPSIPAQLDYAGYSQQPFLTSSSSSSSRWGVQSARTSPVRTSGVSIPQSSSSQWTPPRGYAYAYAQQQREEEWTPPRLPRFAEFERLSTGSAMTMPCPPPPPASLPPPTATMTQESKTHPPAPRRAVFANAGPPGVSGYVYAWGYPASASAY